MKSSAHNPDGKPPVVIACLPLIPLPAKTVPFPALVAVGNAAGQASVVRVTKLIVVMRGVGLTVAGIEYVIMRLLSTRTHCASPAVSVDWTQSALTLTPTGVTPARLSSQFPAQLKEWLEMRMILAPAGD